MGPPHPSRHPPPPRLTHFTHFRKRPKPISHISQHAAQPNPHNPLIQRHFNNIQPSSTYFSHFAIFAFKGHADLAAELRERADRQRTAVDTHLWCGDHYAYGFDDDGHRFGAEERVFLNTQTWALLAGCGDDTRRAACLNAIQDLGTPFGPRLLAPPFPDWDPQVGRLSIKVPGFGENGSVYCHGAAFAATAVARAGDADAALDLVTRIRPSNPDHPPSKSKQIPIWQPNAWFGNLDAPDAGHSTEALATGTTTWLLLTVVEELAGFKIRCDGVHLPDIPLPSGWESLTLERTVKGKQLKLTRLRDGSSLLNGHPKTDSQIPFKNLPT